MTRTVRIKSPKNKNKSMADTRLQVVVDLVDKASSKMKSITGGFDNISQKAASAGIKLTAFGTAVGLALKQTIDASNELTNSLTGLNSVANAFGANADKAKEAALALASDGLMSVSDAATGLKNLLASRMSLDQAVNLMNAFKDSAAFGRQSALSFGQAIRGATEGIKNQNSVLVDNAGVTKNLSNILVEAGYSAQDLSKAATDTGVRMALYNGILKETAAFQGDAARLSDSLSGAQARLATQVFNLKAQMGDALAPVVKDSIEKISGLLNKVMDWVQKNPELTATILKVTAALAAFTVVMGVLLGIIAVVTNPISLFIAALILLGTAVWFFIKTIKENWGMVKKFFVDNFEDAKKAVVEFGKVLKNIFTFNWGAFEESGNSFLRFLYGISEQVGDVIIPAIKEFFVGLWNSIVETFNNVINSIVGFGTSLKESVVSAFMKVVDGIQIVIEAVWNVVKFGFAFAAGLVIGAFELVGIDLPGVLGSIKDGIVGFANGAWDAMSKFNNWVKEGVSSTTSWMSDKWNGFWSDAKTVTVGVSQEISTATDSWLTRQTENLNEKLSKHVETFVAKYNQIKTLTTDVYNFLSAIVKEKMQGVLDDINSFLEPIKAGFKSIWDGVKGVTSDALDGLKSLVKSTLNSIIDAINAAISAINKVASKGAEGLGISIPQIGKIPRLAKGGIVDKPTFAMIGEDGPEAVVPLNKKNAPPGMGGMTVNITVNGDISGEELIEKIGDALTRRLQLSTAVV